MTDYKEKQTQLIEHGEGREAYIRNGMEPLFARSGFSGSEIAQRLNLAQSTLSKVRTGNIALTTLNLYRFAEACDGEVEFAIHDRKGNLLLQLVSGASPGDPVSVSQFDRAGKYLGDVIKGLSGADDAPKPYVLDMSAVKNFSDKQPRNSTPAIPSDQGTLDIATHQTVAMLRRGWGYNLRSQSSTAMRPPEKLSNGTNGAPDVS